VGRTLLPCETIDPKRSSGNVQVACLTCFVGGRKGSPLDFPAKWEELTSPALGPPPDLTCQSVDRLAATAPRSGNP
jgi:hypothetical protein